MICSFGQALVVCGQQRSKLGCNRRKESVSQLKAPSLISNLPSTSMRRIFFLGVPRRQFGEVFRAILPRLSHNPPPLLPWLHYHHLPSLSLFSPPLANFFKKCLQSSLLLPRSRCWEPIPYSSTTPPLPQHSMSSVSNEKEFTYRWTISLSFSKLMDESMEPSSLLTSPTASSVPCVRILTSPSYHRPSFKRYSATMVLPFFQNDHGLTASTSSVSISYALQSEETIIGRSLCCATHAPPDCRDLLCSLVFSFSILTSTAAFTTTDKSLRICVPICSCCRLPVATLSQMTTCR